MRRRFGNSEGLTGGRLASLMLVGLAACTAEAPTTPTGLPPELAPASSNPVVTSTLPSSSARNVTLDVHVLGSGFDRTAQVTFLLNGLPDGRVRTNSTKYLKSSELVANVTIATDATPQLYDVQVALSTGRKGIGTELFTVLTIVNLGSLDGGATKASAVNASGMVAGSSVLTKVKCGGGLNAEHPYVWTPSTGMVDIGVPGGFCVGQVASINGSGVIVGQVKGQPARWLPNGAGGWAGELLPFLGSSGSASDVNESGVIAGQVHLNAGLSGAVWSSSGALSVLPNLPGVGSCAAMGINDSGVITGRCAETDASGTLVFTHAVVWTSATQPPSELQGLPGADRNFAVRINDQGVAVGYNLFPDGTVKAVRWVPSGTTWAVEDLGTLGGASQATDINQAGQIVGWSRATSQTNHAFLWEPGQGMRDLGVWHNGDEASAAGINDPAVGIPLEVVGQSGTNPIVWRP